MLWADCAHRRRKGQNQGNRAQMIVCLHCFCLRHVGRQRIPYCTSEKKDCKSTLQRNYSLLMLNFLALAPEGGQLEESPREVVCSVSVSQVVVHLSIYGICQLFSVC